MAVPVVEVDLVVAVVPMILVLVRQIDPLEVVEEVVVVVQLLMKMVL